MQIKRILVFILYPFRHPADVQHFRVMRDSRGQYYLWSERFPSLNQLVEYYKKTSISKQSLLLLKETQKEVRAKDGNLPGNVRSHCVIISAVTIWCCQWI